MKANGRRAIQSAAMALLAAFLGAPAGAATIYVDRNQTTNTQDGLTWATAWTNFASALTQLAATNALVKGGHTVEIAAGTYVEQVAVTPFHSGTNGSPNTFLASGNVIVDGTTYGFWLSNATHDVVLDGFSLTGCTSDGLHSDYATNCVVMRCDSYYNGACGFYLSYSSTFTLDSCNAYGNTTRGMFLYRGGTPNHRVRYCNIYANGSHGLWSDIANGNSVSNSVIYGNGQDGLYLEGGSIRVANCIIALNRGTYGRGIYNNGSPTVYNNCFYGNRENVHAAVSEWDVNHMYAWSSNNIVALPSFSGLRDGWDFSRFYEDSPCLGAGAGGAHMGSATNPTLTALSSNTYYVAASGGDDTRSRTDATSPATPWRTVTNAAAQAIAGDSIRIASGVYTGTVSPASGSYTRFLRMEGDGAPTLRGTNGYGLKLDRQARVCVSGVVATGITRSVSMDWTMDCSLTNSAVFGPTGGDAVHVENGYSNTLRDVTARNAANGIYVTACAGLDILRCSVRSCSTYGLNVYRYVYGLTIDGCTVCSNTSGIYYDGQGSAGYPRLSNNNVYDCVTFGFNINYSGGRVTFGNNNMFRNGTGLSLANPNTWAVRNCTIVSNTAYGIRETTADSMPVCSNNCFYANNNKSYVKSTGTSYNTPEQINGLAGFSNNLVASPSFVAPPSDFHLLAGSPCIDAGTPATTLALDYYGNPRLYGPAVDIGICEFRPDARAGTVIALR